METQPIIAKQERIDDIPLLLGMMQIMKIADIVDKHLVRHYLHQGMSNGNLLIGWLAFILTESDHRKSAVQKWANNHQQTLESFFATPLRPHEFNDDRLGILLSRLAAANWDDLEGDLFLSCFDVYELPKDTFRVDASTSCGYHTIEPDGIMQLGHSKDHRPDLPQLKIMAAVTQPLAFLVSSAVVPGNQTDDGLYWPTILEVKKKVGGSGLLFCGDCKMAALLTRGRIAHAKDYYLTPLPNSGDTAQQLGSWIDTALAKDEAATLQRFYKRTEGEEPEPIGKGYEFRRTLHVQVDQKQFTWKERVQIVQSLSHWKSQNTTLHKSLRQAEQELGRLTATGKGRKIFRSEDELHAAIVAIENAKGVEGLLEVVVRKEEKETKKYSKPGRPGNTAVAEVEVAVRYRIASVCRKEESIKEKAKRLGWRVFTTNAPLKRLTLEGSVLTYREGGGLERPFHQMKDAPLGIRPLFVKRDEQVVGLTRLLLIALRVLTLIEIVVRGKLEESGEALRGLHEAQQNKKESKPTGKRLLRALAGLEITLSLIQMGQQRWWYLPPLPKLLVRVLELLGLPASLYTNLVNTPSRQPGYATSTRLDASG